MTALKEHLMNPELFAVFCEEFTRRMNERRMEARTNIDAARSEIPRIERDLKRLVDRFLKDDGAAEGETGGQVRAPADDQIGIDVFGPRIGADGGEGGVRIVAHHPAGTDTRPPKH